MSRRSFFLNPFSWDGSRNLCYWRTFPTRSNPETWIPYRLSELANVNIRIHDASGRQVRALNLGTKPAGNYLSRSQAAYWDGRNDYGEAGFERIVFLHAAGGRISQHPPNESCEISKNTVRTAQKMSKL